MFDNPWYERTSHHSYESNKKRCQAATSAQDEERCDAAASAQTARVCRMRIRQDTGTDDSVFGTTIGLRGEGARKIEQLWTDCFYSEELLYSGLSIARGMLIRTDEDMELLNSYKLHSLDNAVHNSD